MFTTFVWAFFSPLHFFIPFMWYVILKPGASITFLILGTWFISNLCLFEPFVCRLRFIFYWLSPLLLVFRARFTFPYLQSIDKLRWFMIRSSKFNKTNMAIFFDTFGEHDIWYHQTPNWYHKQISNRKSKIPNTNNIIVRLLLRQQCIFGNEKIKINQACQRTYLHYVQLDL